MADSLERIHEPTPYRRETARREGPPPRSNELVGAVVLLAALAGLALLAGGVIESLGEATQRQLSGAAWVSIDSPFVVQQYHLWLGRLAAVLLPLLGVIVAAAIAVNLAQVGPRFTPEKLLPDMSRVDPGTNFGRIASIDSAMRTAAAAVKLAVIVGVVAMVLYGRRLELIQLAALAPIQVAGYLADLLLWTSLKLAGVLLALALLDYAWLRWRHELSLRMTPEELREEMRQQQGPNKRRQR